MPDSLAYYITALRKDLNAYSDARLKQYGLTDGLFYYIIYIGKNPGCSLSDAAHFLRADNGHVTRCIGKLEQLGYWDEIVCRNLNDGQREQLLELLRRVCTQEGGRGGQSHV